MHMTLQVNDQTIAWRRTAMPGNRTFQGFALSLTVTGETDADRRFNALADGGQGSSRS
jgi:uncharacterized glyoxalase superfamily protein PhnB